MQFNLAMLSAGLFVILIMAFKGYLSWFNIVAFVMAVATFWGMVLIVGFMGVGLVEIPRKIWRKSIPEHQLIQIESQAVSMRDRVEEAELDVIESLQEFWSIPNRDDSFGDFYKYTQVIEQENMEIFSLYKTRITSAINTAVRREQISVNYLAKLRKKIRNRYLKLENVAWDWENAKTSAFFYQDIIHSKNNNLDTIESSINPIRSWPLWEKKLAILQSEAMISIFPRLTIIRALFRPFENNSLSIEIFSFLILLYMTASIYLSVTKLGLFGTNMLFSNRKSSERSLIACGAQLCRLMIPLCYNFLDIATPNIGTEFQQLMGRIDSVPILGESLNRWIPVIVILPALLTYINAYDRIMKVFNPEIFIEDSREMNVNSQNSHEIESAHLPSISEGKLLLKEARAILERTYNNPRIISSPRTRAREEGTFHFLYDTDIPSDSLSVTRNQFGGL
ncbi:hypothetical protein BB559_003175 [Furculomyces boomerangus]|uniref:Uncharacterized protein n=1 Tax=Furculomyces boomerangus TaxID=61424 RepID=A0A2T9YN28_9FUNG|nr:hypothetical protein BB559_003175 [Furculomyces boomerangus]